MNILVTGSNGFVGKNLIENLKNIRDGKDRTRSVIGMRFLSMIWKRIQLYWSFFAVRLILFFILPE